MKKRTIKTTALLSLLVFAGCDRGMLDALPTDRLLTDNFWKSQADAEMAVNALYNDLDGTSIFFLDALTDIAHVNQPFDTDAYIAVGIYDASSSRLYNTWRNAYKGIGGANYFLDNVGKLDNVADAALIDRYRGEAKTLRAYQYSKLAYLFGEVPLISTTLTLAESRSVRRASLKDIHDFIDGELGEAADLLPDSYTGTDRGRITKWAAIGLKARNNLYAGRYHQAAEDADRIIQSGQFALWTSYGSLFSYAAENNTEVLLDKQFLENSQVHNAFYLLAPYSQRNSQSAYVPTKALVDQYEMANGKPITDPMSGYDPDNPYTARDPRLHLSIFLDGDPLPDGTTFRPAPNSGGADAVGSTYIASTTGFNVKKYVDPADFPNPQRSGLNIILLRYAEVLLTYAEAKTELGEIDQSVLDAINTVRNARTDVKLPDLPGGMSQAQLREAIRRERTVELAFEGLHLADVRRWRTAELVVPGKIHGITYQNDNGETVVVEAASESRTFNPAKHYLWPVPQKERDMNPNLEQNPGW